MHATDIVGYSYQADIYCGYHAAVAACARYGGSEILETESNEAALDAAAEAAGINREDEGSFDSGDFPKVIFANQAHDGCSIENGCRPGQCSDACSVCHEPLGGDCPNEPVPQEYMDEFLQGYATAMLWANTVEYDQSQLTFDGEPAESHDVDPAAWQSPGDPLWALHAFTPQSQEQVSEDCEDFVNAQWHILKDLSYPGQRGQEYSDAELAGHDFALTRNGHGTGFWDRGLGEAGDKLTEASKPYGESTAHYSTDDNGACVHLDDERRTNEDHD